MHNIVLSTQSYYLISIKSHQHKKNKTKQNFVSIDVDNEKRKQDKSEKICKSKEDERNRGEEPDTRLGNTKKVHF